MYDIKKLVVMLFLIVALFTTAAFGADYSDASLILHMDDESGELIDSSGNGLNAVPGEGEASYEGEGMFGASVGFNEDTFIINDIDILNPSENSFTVSVWVNLNEEQDSQTGIIGKAPNDNYWIFELDNRYMMFESRTPDRYYGFSNDKLEIDQWHNLVYMINREENLVKLYIDGELDSEHEIDFSESYISENVVRIGKHVGYFDGNMDELIVWKRSLSDEEVADYFHNAGLIYQVSQLERQIEYLESQIDELLSDFEASEDILLLVEDLQAQVDELYDIVGSLESEDENLQEQIDELDSRLDSLIDILIFAYDEILARLDVLEDSLYGIDLVNFVSRVELYFNPYVNVPITYSVRVDDTMEEAEIHLVSTEDSDVEFDQILRTQTLFANEEYTFNDIVEFSEVGLYNFEIIIVDTGMSSVPFSVQVGNLPFEIPSSEGFISNPEPNVDIVYWHSWNVDSYFDVYFEVFQGTNVQYCEWFIEDLDGIDLDNGRMDLEVEGFILDDEGTVLVNCENRFVESNGLDEEGVFLLTTIAQLEGAVILDDNLYIGIDNTNPSINEVTPSTGDFSGDLVVEVDTEDELSGIDRVWVTMSPKEGGVSYSLEASLDEDSGLYVVTFDTLELGIPDGSYDITALVYDVAGNSNSLTVDPIIDNTDPSIELLSNNFEGELFDYSINEEGLLLWLKMNDASGSLLDSSDYDHTVEVYEGSAEYNQNGKVDESILFGNDSFIINEDNYLDPVNGSLSMSVWVKIDNEQEHQTGLFRNSLGIDGGYWIFELSEDKMFFEVRDLGVTSSDYNHGWSTNSLNLGEWNHLVYVIDSENNQVTLYLNGELDSVHDVVLDENISPQDEAVIGRHVAFLDGYMDELIVWGRVITGDEVKAEYYRGANLNDGELYEGELLEIELNVSDNPFNATNGSFSGINRVTLEFEDYNTTCDLVLTSGDSETGVYSTENCYVPYVGGSEELYEHVLVTITAYDNAVPENSHSVTTSFIIKDSIINFVSENCSGDNCVYLVNREENSNGGEYFTLRNRDNSSERNANLTIAVPGQDPREEVELNLAVGADSERYIYSMDNFIISSYEANITSVTYNSTNEELSIVGDGNGTQEILIYVNGYGNPNSVLFDEVAVSSWNYNETTSIVTLTVTFGSPHTISLDWTAISTSSSSGGSGGGSSRSGSNSVDTSSNETTQEFNALNYVVFNEDYDPRDVQNVDDEDSNNAPEFVGVEDGEITNDSDEQQSAITGFSIANLPPAAKGTGIALIVLLVVGGIILFIVKRKK